VPITEAQVQEWLKSVIDPTTGKDYVSSKEIKKVQVNGDDVSVDVVLGYPAQSQLEPVRHQIQSALAAAPGVGWYLLRSPPAASRAAPQPPSIAVLPFSDMSEKHDQEYFADGVAEEILNALAHVNGLKVIGRTSSFAFKGKSEDLKSIGQKLEVGNILEGSLRKDGDQLRITTQLIRVDDGSHLWSETYDRRLAGIFQVQEEIAARWNGADDELLFHQRRLHDVLLDHASAIDGDAIVGTRSRRRRESKRTIPDADSAQCERDWIVARRIRAEERNERGSLAVEARLVIVPRHPHRAVRARVVEHLVGIDPGNCARRIELRVGSSRGCR